MEHGVSPTGEHDAAAIDAGYTLVVGYRPMLQAGKSTVLLYPPAQEALEILIADTEQHEAADLQVWLNRHEFRTDRVRVLLSPKTQAPKKVVNDYFMPSAGTRMDRFSVPLGAGAYP